MSLPLAPFGPRAGLRGMVAAADQLAASAGLDMLARGGSAADAAVATGTVMAVVGPHMSGLGGDVLAMVSMPGAAPEALLAVGRAGAGSDPAALRAEGAAVMPLRGDIRSVPVPGAVDGWLALHARHGRLPLDIVLAPAVELAEEGFAASVLLALSSHLVHGLPGARQLCPHGPLDVGQRVRLPGIARTLRAIARDGRHGFYGGEFGRGLLELGRGHYAPADLGRDLAEWCAPIRQRVWGHDLWTVPPPSQGYLTLASAAVAERVGLADNTDDPAWAHLLVESWRAVGHDRPQVLFDGADGAALLGEERLAAAAARVDSATAAPPDVRPGSAELGTGWSAARLGDGDTTHLCVLDAEGIGVSLTQSNALDFGSHLVEPATGVFLHDRGVGFSLVPGHPAELAPGRRPPHTLSPLLVTSPKGVLTHLVGAMGGDAQPQINSQLLARLLVAGEDPAAAVAASRLVLDAPSAGPFRLWWGHDLTVLVESDAPPAWQRGLAARGHTVRAIGAFDPVAVGCAQVVAVQRDAAGTAVLVGGSDPRSPTGAALGR
ncbi:MAG TPA: gamma-glutamyltransferase [Acidimicrobiales bacterium]|nr:gamma-glutamyltransferase [Acidimicrobiales bacterium]